MISYIITGRTEDGSVWATGSVTTESNKKIKVSWGSTKEQAMPYSKIVAECIIEGAPEFVYNLKMVEIDIINDISKCGLNPHDMSRMHEKNKVMITLPSYVEDGGHLEDTVQYPFHVVHDTGKRIWVASTYSDEWPEEVRHVGDGTDKGFDCNGNCLASIPVSWCTFYSDNDAENIVACIDADEKLLSYM